MKPDERELLDAYRALGPRARAHTVLRWRSAPLGAIERMVPMAGDILDLGCGHGLLALHLAQRSAARRVLGVDLDPGKLRLARDAARALDPVGQVRFEVIDDRWTPPAAAFDAVLLVDVLYLLPPDGMATMLAAAADALRLGGRLIVKEMADRPRWKRSVTTAQEHLAVRALGLTHGQTIRLPSEAEVRSAMETHGLVVSRIELGRRSLHPHVGFAGRRPNRSPSIPSPSS